MENVSALLPENFAEFEKNHENYYSVKGIGKTYSKQDFKEYSETFSRLVSKDPLGAMMDDEIYQPGFYLVKMHTRDPAYSKILEKVMLTMLSNFHKLLNQINESHRPEDRIVQAFLRMVVLWCSFIDKSIITKSEENILDEDGEVKKRKQKDSDGYSLFDLVKRVMVRLSEFCFLVVYRNLLKQLSGLGRLMYRAAKQCLKDSLGVSDQLGSRDPNNTSTHIFTIIEELLDLGIVKVPMLQFDLTNLVNDVEIAGKTVGNFLVLCSQSKKSHIFELASTTLIYTVKKHCMFKGKQQSESNSVRFFKQFYEYLAPEVPDIFNTYLQEFLFLFDSQCHPLRNAMTEVLKQLIILKCGADDNNERANELGVNTETLRQDLLNWIMQRTRDKSSWCRAKALSDLHELMQLRMVPHDFIKKLFEKAAIHIRDPTINVRKKAMLLASEIMSFYISTMKFPDEANLESDLADIRSQLEELRSRVPANEEMREEIDTRMATLIKYDKLVQFFQQTYQILGNLLPQVVSLMFRSSVDSLEAIRLLVKMKTLGQHKVDSCLPKMFTLIWSEDAAIINEVKASFINLYVLLNRKENACKNIVKLLKSCDKSTKVCVLRVIRSLFEDCQKNKRLEPKNRSKYYLEEDMIRLFWSFFHEKFENASSKDEEEECRLALKVIAEGLVFYPQIFYVIKKQDVIFMMKIYLSKERRLVDWEVICDFCKIISSTKSHFNNEESTHLLILKAIEEIIHSNQGVPEPGWYTATQSFVQAVVDVSKCPEMYLELFLKKMSEFLVSVREYSFELASIKVNQLIWTAGEVALKLLIRIDDVEDLIKRNKKAEDTQPSIEKEKTSQVDEPEELDQAMGGFDSVLQSQRDILREITENQLIYNNMLGNFLPLVKKVAESIASNKGVLEPSEVNTAIAHSCILTLFKFAIVSQRFCKENIPLIMEMISNQMDPALVLKSLLGLSDLVKRFPQVVEPYSRSLFHCLESEHRNVKKTAMIIITHLILNDMLKIKGEIVDIIMKLADEDIEIRKFTELFIIQLHKKDPMIVNNLLPDALARFSTLDVVTPDVFEKFASTLLGFIDKEKQATLLAENLLQRFKSKDNMKELVFSAICLNIISSNLSVLKVMESYADVYIDKLCHPEIKVYFKEALEKLKASARGNKRGKGAVIHTAIDALEAKLRPFFDMELNDEEERLIQGASSQAPTDKSKRKLTRKQARGAALTEEDANSQSRPITLTSRSHTDQLVDEDEDISQAGSRSTMPKSANNRKAGIVPPGLVRGSPPGTSGAGRMKPEVMVMAIDEEEESSKARGPTTKQSSRQHLKRGNQAGDSNKFARPLPRDKGRGDSSFDEGDRSQVSVKRGRGRPAGRTNLNKTKMFDDEDESDDEASGHGAYDDEDED